jgi:hypothetical protein
MHMARPKHTEPRVRLNLEISQALRDRIERLQHTMEADSITETIRRSCAIADELVNATKRGDVVVLRDGNGNEKTIVLV